MEYSCRMKVELINGQRRQIRPSALPSGDGKAAGSLVLKCIFQADGGSVKERTGAAVDAE